MPITAVPDSDVRIATLISGGLDSAVMTAWAASEGIGQHAFFVNYGQDNFDREYACARINTQRWNVPLEVIDISPLRHSFVGRFPFPINLYDCDVANPLGQITTFALSAMVAGVSVLAGRYVLGMGVHHTDMDLRPVLRNNMSALEKTVNFVVESHSDERFQLLLPFMDTKRPEVVTLGLDLGVEFENTWSCHRGIDQPCGDCEGCRERIEAFQVAGTDDPQLTRPLTVPVRARAEARIVS